MKVACVLVLTLLALVQCQYPYPNVVCRCNAAKADRPNPTYPTLKECKIPLTFDDYVSSFVENDNTWCPIHEFGAGGYTTNPAQCPGTTPCKQVLTSTDGRWTCKVITPHCCEDAPRVDGSVYNPYNCAGPDSPLQSGKGCNIKCQTGYTGGGMAKCVNGNWTSLPTCVNSGCTSPATCQKTGTDYVGCTIPNTATCQTGAKDGAICPYTCPANSKKTGTLECDNGKWTIEGCHKPKPTDCTGPVAPSPANGKYNCADVAVGGTCPLRCGYGFTPAGTAPVCVAGAGGKSVWKIASGHNARHCKCKKFEKIQPNTPLACVFGGFSGIDRINFIVDQSGSMGRRFKVGSKTYTRMAYVEKALDAAIAALSATQYFNVIPFSSSATKWRTTLQIANAANKASAQRFVDGLKARGGTNMVAAIAAAKRYDNTADGVFLLTDGVPNGGYGKVFTALKGWKNKAGQTVKVNPIAFQAPRSSQMNMRKIASNSGGNYHHVV